MFATTRLAVGNDWKQFVHRVIGGVLATPDYTSAGRVAAVRRFVARRWM